jgi:predicted AlkP superfamily phosphohydrolase/phosphomutase
MSDNNKQQIVILGLDGTTNNVIQSLREMGVLPNLDRIIKDGLMGNLNSTMPPVTGPA